MKTLSYSIVISKPQSYVFNQLTDNVVYPLWAQAWGDGMICEGMWIEGEHISFFNKTQGGTKVVINRIKPNISIETEHVAMVNTKNVEIPVTDEMMHKWIGSKENYYLEKQYESETLLRVVMVTDEAFEQMMNKWTKALELFKAVCEA